jgi:hypothetical protein
MISQYANPKLVAKFSADYVFVAASVSSLFSRRPPMHYEYMTYAEFQQRQNRQNDSSDFVYYEPDFPKSSK